MEYNNLEVQHNPAHKRFEIIIDEHLNIVEYILVGDRIIFTHTEVHPSLEGKGIASLLAKTGLEYAKTHHLNVVPLCPYVAGYMKRHPAYQELLAAGFHV